MLLEHLLHFNEQNEDSAFPPMYHGTSSDQLVKTEQFNQDEIYLTEDEEDAANYAYGVHMGGAFGNVKYVLTIWTKQGKVLDGNQDIQQIIMDEHEQFDSIEQYSDAARKEGYRYIAFMHPSTLGNEEAFVVISLFPNQDLKIIDVQQI